MKKYKVQLGDRFIAPDGETFTFTEFYTADWGKNQKMVRLYWGEDREAKGVWEVSKIDQLIDGYTLDLGYHARRQFQKDLEDLLNEPNT